MSKLSRGWVTALAFAMAFLFTPFAFATVLVFPAEVTNVEPAEGDAIVAILADEYASASGEQVSVVQPSADEPAGSYSQRAEALGGKEYLVVRAVRLEEKIRVRVTRHRADGTVIATESMTAVSLDDMEPVTERLALALTERTSTDDTRTHRNVTGKETRAKNRMFNEKIVGVKSQIDLPLASGVTIAPPIALGVDFRFEADAYFLEFGAGFLIPTSTEGDQVQFGGLYSELGASAYITDDEVSLYAGGGVLPRAISSGDGEAAANAAIYGQFGAMFARSSSSRLYADVRVAQNVTRLPLSREVEDTTDEFGFPTTEVVHAYPTELILELGIGW